MLSFGLVFGQGKVGLHDIYKSHACIICIVKYP